MDYPQICNIMKGKINNEWFAAWFDSPAYHILYGNRDNDEALNLVENLDGILSAEVKKVLDVGCGAGRHVLAWEKLGYKASGFDLSSESIMLAKSKPTNADFRVLDMRDLKNQSEWSAEFDLISNLFTSFGYFSKEEEHKSVLHGFNHVLKPGGLLIFDYLNVPYSQSRLVASEIVNIDQYTFMIERQLIDGFFQKSIRFKSPEGEDCHFIEQVRAWTANDLKILLLDVGLQTEKIFGDYDLGDFSDESPRCIIVARKILDL
jgi:SAM-dependent methyltransferase|tara:strand:- start:33 stop:818 length:786 start_codon:yes stop_codon:yes gene_type:complete